MSGDSHVEADGIVKDSCRGVLTVTLSSGQIIKAQLSGKMRTNKINVIPGDKVLVKMSTYDLSRGIIFKLIKSQRYTHQQSE